MSDPSLARRLNEKLEQEGLNALEGDVLYALGIVRSCARALMILLGVLVVSMILFFRVSWLEEAPGLVAGLAILGCLHFIFELQRIGRL